MFLQRENGDPFGTKRDSHVNLGPQMEAGGSVGGGGISFSIVALPNIKTTESNLYYNFIRSCCINNLLHLLFIYSSGGDSTIKFSQFSITLLYHSYIS